MALYSCPQSTNKTMKGQNRNFMGTAACDGHFGKYSYNKDSYELRFVDLNTG